jgi:hypothetical protein
MQLKGIAMDVVLGKVSGLVETKAFLTRQSFKAQDIGAVAGVTGVEFEWVAVTFPVA